MTTEVTLTALNIPRDKATGEAVTRITVDTVFAIKAAAHQHHLSELQIMADVSTSLMMTACMATEDPRAMLDLLIGTLERAIESQQ